jgi:hypothetical protein
MIRKTWIASILAATLATILAFAPTTAQGATASTGPINVTVTVDAFAEWAAANSYTIAATDFDGHITGATQTRTATRDLTFYTNVAVTITAAGGTNAGVLTDATTSTHPLTTQYNLTANSGANTWLGAATALATPVTFFARSYPLDISSAAGTYTMRLTVTATPVAGSAPAADNYTAGLSLTATW